MFSIVTFNFPTLLKIATYLPTHLDAESESTWVSPALLASPLSCLSASSLRSIWGGSLPICPASWMCKLLYRQSLTGAVFTASSFSALHLTLHQLWPVGLSWHCPQLSLFSSCWMLALAFGAPSWRRQSLHNRIQIHYAPRTRYLCGSGETHGGVFLSHPFPRG